MRGYKLEREKRTVTLMIELYCRKKLKSKDMPEEYRKLTEYAILRLDRCRFGNAKASCKKCSIHCYQKDKRDEIIRVMKWVGPRMFFYSPITALRHLLGV